MKGSESDTNGSSDRQAGVCLTIEAAEGQSEADTPLHHYPAVQGMHQMTIGAPCGWFDFIGRVLAAADLIDRRTSQKQPGGKCPQTNRA